MIRGVYLNAMTDNWDECKVIRSQVFESELNEVIDNEKEKAIDDLAMHLLLFDEQDHPAGTVRLSFDMNGIFEFDYLAVLQEKRKNGLGDFLMHMLFDKARLCGARYLASNDIKHHPEYFKKYGFVIENGRLILNLNEYFNTHKCCH